MRLKYFTGLAIVLSGLLGLLVLENGSSNPSSRKLLESQISEVAGLSQKQSKFVSIKPSALALENAPNFEAILSTLKSQGFDVLESRQIQTVLGSSESCDELGNAITVLQNSAKPDEYLALEFKHLPSSAGCQATIEIILKTISVERL